MSPETTAMEAGKVTPCSPSELLGAMKRQGKHPSAESIVLEINRRMRLGQDISGDAVIGSLNSTWAYPRVGWEHDCVDGERCLHNCAMGFCVRDEAGDIAHGSATGAE